MLLRLEKKINNYLKHVPVDIENSKIALLLSGGVDSITLAHMLIRLRHKNNFKLVFFHFNHHAHANSNKLENLCISFSKNNKVDMIKYDIDVPLDKNFESFSRVLRYKYSNLLANKNHCNLVLTAHHIDDQIETLYMKYEDNSDWISRIGIREELGLIKRPLLGFKKNILINYAKSYNLKWIEDPTNTDLAYRRNHVRHIDLPNFIDTNREFVESILLNAKINYNNMNQILNEFESVYKKIIIYTCPSFTTLNLKAVKNYEIGYAKLFVYWIIKRCFRSSIKRYTHGFWNQFIKFLKESNNGSVFYIDNYVFYIDRNNMYLYLTNKETINNRVTKKVLNNINWYNYNINIKIVNRYNKSNEKKSMIIKKSLFDKGLYVRNWKNGDRIKLYNNYNNKLVSDLFIDNKINKFKKNIQPIVTDKKDNIIWIPNIAYSRLIDRQDQNLIKITCLEN